MGRIVWTYTYNTPNMFVGSMLSHKAPQNVLGNSQQQTSSSYTSNVQNVLQLNHGPSQKAAISVKLTDDCFQNLQMAARNNYPVLVHVNKTEIIIEITTPSSSLKFNCYMQRVPGISFQALKKTDNTFDDIAHISMRAQVRPTQQTLIMGREKINQGSKLRERESNKRQTQMLPGPVKPGERNIFNGVKQIGSRVPIGNNTNNASIRNGSNTATSLPASLVPSKSSASASESPRDLRDCSLRIRVIHYIAAGRFNTQHEIVEQIMSEGLPRTVPMESAKRKIREIICEVAVEYNDPPRITLDPKYFREVDINWSFYDSTDRENAKRVLSKTEVAVGSNFAPTRASRRAPMVAPRRKRDNSTPTMSNSTTTSPDLASDGSNCSTPSPSDPSVMSVDSGYSPSSCEKRKISLTDLTRIPEDDVFSSPPMKKRLMDSEPMNKLHTYYSSPSHKAETTLSPPLMSDPKAESKSAFVGNGSTPSSAEKNDHVVAAMDTSTDIGSSQSSTNNDDTDRSPVAYGNSQKAIDTNSHRGGADVTGLSRSSSNAVIVDEKSKNDLFTPSRLHQHHSDKDRMKEDRTKEKKDKEQRRAERQREKAEKERLKAELNQSKPDKERAKLEKERRKAEKKREKAEKEAKQAAYQEKLMIEQAKKVAEEQKQREKELASTVTKPDNHVGSVPVDASKPSKSDKKPKDRQKSLESKKLTTDKPMEKSITKDIARDVKPEKLHRKDKVKDRTEKLPKDPKESDVPRSSSITDKVKLEKDRKAEKRMKPRSEGESLIKSSKLDSPAMKQPRDKPVEKPERANVASRPTSTLENFPSRSASSQRNPIRNDAFSSSYSSSPIGKLMKAAEKFDKSGTTTPEKVSRTERPPKERSEKKKEKQRLADSAQPGQSSQVASLPTDEKSKKEHKERSKSERRSKENARLPMTRTSMAMPGTPDSHKSTKSDKLEKCASETSLASKKSHSKSDKSEKSKTERRAEKDHASDVMKRHSNGAPNHSVTRDPVKPSFGGNVDAINKKPAVDDRKTPFTTSSTIRPSKEADKPQKPATPSTATSVVKKSESDSKPLIIQPAAKLSKPIVREIKPAPSKPTTPLSEGSPNAEKMPLDELLKVMSDPVKPSKRYEEKYPVLRTPSEAKIYSDHEVEYYKLYEKSYNSLVNVQRDLSVYVDRMNKATSAEERKNLEEKIRKYAGNCLHDETFNNQRKTVANMTNAIQVLRSRLEEFYGPDQS